MDYLFVYYPPRDAEFVKRLISDLRQNGVDARRATGLIPPGKDWSPEVKKIKKRARALLYVLDSAMLSLESWSFATDTKVLFCTTEKTNVRSMKTYTSVSDVNEKTRILNFHDDYDLPLRELLSELPESIRQNQPLEPEAPMSKGYVFISYAQEDTDFVEKLREFFKARGFGYWDYQESERAYQGRITLELEQVIRGAVATVTVLSPAWKNSQWAEKEFLFSEDVNTPLFLCRAREMEPTLSISSKLYIDFVFNESSGFQKLEDELRRSGLVD